VCLAGFVGSGGFSKRPTQIAKLRFCRRVLALLHAVGCACHIANVHTCVVWTLALLVRDVTDSNQAPCVFVACAIMMLRVDLLSFRMPGCGQADSRTLSLPRPVGCRAPFVHCL
jgi:hypothetical protein